MVDTQPRSPPPPETPAPAERAKIEIEAAPSANHPTPTDALIHAQDRSPLAAIRRRLVQWIGVKPLSRSPLRPIVSFTFDDFPKSAAETGAAVVESGGGRACFFAASGLAGEIGGAGDLFDADDVAALAAAGHEIGMHTHTHLDCTAGEPDAVRSEIEANRQALLDMGLNEPPAHFAYPGGRTTVALKENLKTEVATARGVGVGVNRKGADLMQLRALRLGAESWTYDRAVKAIAAATRRPAWVIFHTHDVRERPSDFGTTPAVLRKLVRLALDSGAAILTPSEAMAELAPPETLSPAAAPPAGRPRAPGS